MTHTYEHYLSDLGALIKEQALAVKRGKDAAAGSGNFDYELGRLTAWHEVVSLMQEQALAFGLESGGTVARRRLAGARPDLRIGARGALSTSRFAATRVLLCLVMIATVVTISTRESAAAPDGDADRPANTGLPTRWG